MRTKQTILAIALGSLISACATPPAGAPSAQHGLQTAGTGVANLVLSPLLIIGGLLEGIASLPFLVGAGVHELNAGLVSANAGVDLDRTYRYAYDRPLERVPDSGDTGQVFHEMRDATAHFQRVLRGYGVPDHERYLLTAVRTADRDGYTLYAVVYRRAGPVRLAGESGPRTLGAADAAYYHPYARDAEGRALDLVVDWAGVPRTAIRDQKGQAILMTLAANSVLLNRRSEEYWGAQRRWVSGEHRDVVAQREAYLQARLGIAG